VLKGNGSIIASRMELADQLKRQSGMASAGMGDVLTGMIASLLAQGAGRAAAAAGGGLAHGAAADAVSRQRPAR